MNPAPNADWKIVDENLRRLAREVAQRDSEIGHWLLAAEDTKPWLKAGMRSIYEYVEHLFGWTPHTITERIRTAKALLLLPQLEAELAAGRMNWSIVRELTRVATAATEDDWIEFARRKTVRTVEKKVAKHVLGEKDGPGRHLASPQAAARRRGARSVCRWRSAWTERPS